MPFTPPVFVAKYEGIWSTAGATQSVSVTTAVNDRLVVVAATSDVAKTLSTPTGGTGLVWTLQQSSAVALNSAVYVWTASATTAETFTLTIAAPTGTTELYGFNVLRFSGSKGFGASAKAGGSGAPTLPITTTADSSAVVWINADHAAVDGATRAALTATAGAYSEQTYSFITTRYTTYAGFHANAGLAGAKSVGLSAPIGQVWQVMGVEVLASTADGIAGLQRNLNRLAGTVGLEDQGAANKWAGRTGLDLIGALNFKAGTVGLGRLAVLNRLANTTGLDQDAASALIP